MLNRVMVKSAVIMIRPTLTSYDIEENVKIVALDVESMKAEEILVMDLFFMIIINYGNVCNTLTSFNISFY